MSKLTPKQEQFCKEYLVDLNATQAAIRAGYSKRTAKSQGQRLLTKVDIQKEIQSLMDKRSKRVEIDADWVLMKLKIVAAKCMQEEKILNKAGEEVLGSFNPLGAEKALELIGKNKKMFTDKFEVDATIQIKEIIRKII